jgi:hypothetical protein
MARRSPNGFGAGWPSRSSIGSGRTEIRDSWVGVFFEGRWIGLDGVILDRAYRER